MAIEQTTRTSRERSPLTRERILAAALAIADRDGLDGVSMRRIAQELKVAPMALYSHVRDKQELLLGLVDVVFGQINTDPPPGRWDDQLRVMARSLRSALLDHPAVVELAFLCASPGICQLAALERAHGILRGAGLPDPVVASASRGLYAYILGAVMLELGGGAEGQRGGFLSLPADRFPNIAALTGHVAVCTGDDHFEYGLDLVLEGLAAQLRDGPSG